MRRLACGAEMILVNAIEDVTNASSRLRAPRLHVFGVNKTEQRLVFNKRAEQAEAATVPRSAPLRFGI